MTRAKEAGSNYFTVRKVDVLTVRSGKVAIETIPATLEAQQAIVGGLIQPLDIGPGLSVVVNEEGLLLDLPFNVQVIGSRWEHEIDCVGAIYFARWNEEGEIVSLHLADIPVIMGCIVGVK